MDRAGLSEAIIQELGTVFMAAVQEAMPELLSADLDGIERRLQAVSRQVFGRVLEQVVAVRAGQPHKRPPCPACGGLLRLVDRARPRQLQGLVGDATVQRPTYVCSRWRQGHAPLDTALGLGQGALTPALARVACRAGLETSFGEASDLLAETLGVAVPADAVRRVTERVGAMAETEQQAAIAQAQQGQVQPDGAGAAVLVVEVDGCQVHLHDAWHEMNVGRVAPLGPALQTDKRSGRTFLRLGPAVCCAGLEAAEEFWSRVYVQACRGGLGQTTRRVVVRGDGAEWIWKRAAQFRGGPRVQVLAIVDITHAYDHLWAVGRAVFDPEAAPWVAPLTDRLYAEGAGVVLAALDTLVPPTPVAAEVVRTTRAYFADNAARMDAPRCVAQQLPIGSGAIESLCKSLSEEREKGAGMGWTGPGAQAVASLRALHRSGDWAHERRALPIDTVGDDRAEGHAPVQGALNEGDRELWFGAQGGVLLALGQTGRGRVGHDVQRVVGALVGPQAGDRDDAVGDLADRAQVLGGDMRRLRPVLAIAGLVDHQHAALVRRNLRVRPRQFQAAAVHRLGLPHRRGEEGLQALDGRLLRLNDGLGSGQCRQGLVAIAGQEQPREVVAEAAALGRMREEVIEARGVLLERTGRGRAINATGHGTWYLLLPRSTTSCPF